MQQKCMNVYFDKSFQCYIAELQGLNTNVYMLLSWVLCMYFCVDLAIDVPDFLDLSRLRATGLQAGEEELPDLMPPIVLPEDTRGTKENTFCFCDLTFIHFHWIFAYNKCLHIRHIRQRPTFLTQNPLRRTPWSQAAMNRPQGCLHSCER